jgi:NADH dehydrogenase
MKPKRIVVLGGGFAGLWSAVGAARKRQELGMGPGDMAITLVNRDAYHSIRVRNYEADLAGLRVPLNDILGPIGVEWVEGEVSDLDYLKQEVSVAASQTTAKLVYDRLVFALGSRLDRPNIPGLAEHTFDVDTYDGALRLDTHLRDLIHESATQESFTVVIVGAGLTGIEAATEMTEKLAAILTGAKVAGTGKVILVDHHPVVGSDMGDGARYAIETALDNLNIETLTGVSIAAVDGYGVTLASGEVIPARTVVWCAGMRANPLTASFPVDRDRFGRIPVDEFMRVKSLPKVFAAGDAAWFMTDGVHASVMSCQHARPMGRFAGHNVVCDLFGQSMLPLHLDWYVTVLDLGREGAVYTQGWNRVVVATGESAKQIKQTINRQRIYPPLSGSAREILDAAEPSVQRPPERPM